MILKPSTGVIVTFTCNGNELVIYEMHVAPLTSKKRGAPARSIVLWKKLPYLQKLGINAVEVMPIAEFSGDFSWGYIRLIPLPLRVFTGTGRL